MHAFLYTFVPPELPQGPDTFHVQPQTSIGIEEIRNIQTFLSRKATQSPQNTVVIYQAHLLTLPAQHAILKTLEEPPGNSQIILITPLPDTLLPTILSRIQIIESHTHLPPADITKTQALFNQLLTAKIVDRLILIDSEGFTRETALQFLSETESILHNQITTLDPQTLSHLYNLLHQTRLFLKANCNLKLALDHFVLNLN